MVSPDSSNPVEATRPQRCRLSSKHNSTLESKDIRSNSKSQMVIHPAVWSRCSSSKSNNVKKSSSRCSSMRGMDLVLHAHRKPRHSNSQGLSYSTRPGMLRRHQAPELLLYSTRDNHPYSMYNNPLLRCSTTPPVASMSTPIQLNRVS